MKIDRHSLRDLADRVKPTPRLHPQEWFAAASLSPRPLFLRVLGGCLFACISVSPCLQGLQGQEPSTESATALEPEQSSPAHSTGDSTPVSRSADDPQKISVTEQSDPRAVGLLHQVLATLVHGPSFHAKVRETVWTNGREVVGVGTYEQAGGGSGRYNLQVTMHDGDGKHRLQQISDGRLAWTRSEIAGKVSLRRVDVGRLDEWVGKSKEALAISPSLTVGAWAELLSTIERDHVLAVVGAKLENEPVWVLTGRLRSNRRAEILAQSGRTDWPLLYPTRVHVAIRSRPDPASNFGELLPIRIEFWSDPLASAESEEAAASETGGRLITLIELYSIQPITPPPAERFRFENRDSEVNFINETDRYIQLHGVHLTERELRQLRR